MATHMTDVPSGPAAKFLTSSSLLTETILPGECAGTATQGQCTGQAMVPYSDSSVTYEEKRLGSECEDVNLVYRRWR